MSSTPSTLTAPAWVQEMEDARTASRRGPELISRQGMAVTAAALQELFGERLVAVIAGVKDAKAVGRWARGEDINGSSEDSRKYFSAKERAKRSG